MPFAVAECPNKHIYDSSLYSSCPYCDTANTPAPDRNPVRMRPDPGVFSDDRKTQLVKSEKVVGWLVCVEGAMTGKSYDLFNKQNSIGRSPLSDACIKGDMSISEKHALIAYDPRHNRFTLVPKTETNLMSLNGKKVSRAVRLTTFDRIEMGKSKFLFVALCGDNFTWESVQNTGIHVGSSDRSTP